MNTVGLVTHTKSSDCNLLIIKSACADYVAAVSNISNKREASATTHHHLAHRLIPTLYHSLLTDNFQLYIFNHGLNHRVYLTQRLGEALQYAVCIITEISGFASIHSSPQTRQQVGGASVHLR